MNCRQAEGSDAMRTEVFRHLPGLEALWKWPFVRLIGFTNAVLLTKLGRVSPGRWLQSHW